MQKESWRIKKYYKMPDGTIVHCRRDKAFSKLKSDKYGEGNFEEVEPTTDKPKGAKK